MYPSQLLGRGCEDTNLQESLPLEKQLWTCQVWGWADQTPVGMWWLPGQPGWGCWGHGIVQGLLHPCQGWGCASKARGVTSVLWRGTGDSFCVALHRECQGSLREGCTGTAELLVRDFGSEVTGAVLQMALGHLSGDQAQVTFQAGQTGCVPFASLGREFLRWE